MQGKFLGRSSRSFFRNNGSKRIAAAWWLLLCGVLVEATSACVQPPPDPPSLWIEIDGDQVWITFHGYTTFGAGTAQSCACAFNAVPSIASIDSVEISGGPSFSFLPDTTVAFGVSKIASGNWTGFLSSVPVPIVADIPVDITFHGTLATGASDGTTYEILRDELLAVGPLIATDEAMVDGTIVGGDHLAIRPAGEIMQVPVELMTFTVE